MLGIVSTLSQLSCFLRSAKLHFFRVPVYAQYQGLVFLRMIGKNEGRLGAFYRIALSSRPALSVDGFFYDTLNTFQDFAYKNYIYFRERCKWRIDLNNAICCSHLSHSGKIKYRTAYNTVLWKVFFPFDHYEISAGILMNRISATRFVARIRHHIIRNVLPYCALLNYTRTRIWEKGVFYA